MQVHFGKKEFGFFPQTYCLPYDSKLLKRAWEDGGTKQKWIIKPVCIISFLSLKKKTNIINENKKLLVFSNTINMVFEENCAFAVKAGLQATD